MNAVIQAVVACGPAVRRVTEETAAQATEIRGRTQALFRVMLRGRALHMPWSPREFWDAFRLARPEYNNPLPQDAPDFFLALRRELARQPFDAEPSPAWASWVAESEFHVTEYRTCAACSATRDNLPPPDQPSLEPERVVMVEMRQGARYVNMMDALADWTGPKPAPAFRCEKCQGMEGVLVRRCRQLPRVLVVRLKRFHQAPGAKARRIDAPVHRLGEDLDLAAHLDATAALAGDPPAAPANSTRYRARAIVCHHEKECHYTCWVRAATGAPEDSWVQYDDSTVGRARGTLPHDVSSDALLLFYEQTPAGAPDCPQPTDPGPDRVAAPERVGAPGPGPGIGDVSDEPGRDVEMTEEEDEQGGVDEAGAAGEEDENDPSDGADAMDTA